MTLIKTLTENIFLKRLVPTMPYLISKHTKGCKKILDLGCGPDSPIKYAKDCTYSLGVDGYRDYIITAKKNKTHSSYMVSNFNNLKFSNNEFDCLLLIDVIEHMPKEDGYKLIKNAKKWAKKIIINSPNGFIKQDSLDGNPLQEHLSGWTLNDMKNIGFKCYGLAGFKFLRKEVDNNTMGDDLLVTIRFYPKIIWFFVSALSQIITYWAPSMSFSIFSVWEKSNEKD